MKIAKRIISFMMAMVIFASFFCNNVGAYNKVSISYVRSSPFAHASFSNTSAYALVRIRNWAEEENTTDLGASTYAYVEDYEDMQGFHNAIAYVNLTVWLADGSKTTISDSNYPDPDEGTIDAVVYGRHCLNDDTHYSIVDFYSQHSVGLVLAERDENGSIINYYADSDGPMIQIGTRFEN